MDSELALIIGRNVNRACPRKDGTWFKIKDVVESIFANEQNGVWHLLSRDRISRKLLWDAYCDAVRHFLNTCESKGLLPDGSCVKLPHFSHYPDLKRGHRWTRTASMTRSQLGAKIKALRGQQRGYEARCQVYERIYDFLTSEDAIVGEVLRVEKAVVPNAQP